MSAGKNGGELVGVAGMAFVAMQFSGTNVEAAETKKPEGSRLKKTLTNAGLYPEPPKGGKTLKTRPSGDMAMVREHLSQPGKIRSRAGGHWTMLSDHVLCTATTRAPTVCSCRALSI